MNDANFRFPHLRLEVLENVPFGSQHLLLLAADHEGEAAVPAGGDLDVGARLLHDVATAGVGALLAELAIRLAFFGWHVEYLVGEGGRDGVRVGEM